MKTRVLTSIKAIVAYTVLVFMVACSNQNREFKSSESKALQNEVKTPDTDIQAASFMGDVKLIKQHIAAGTDINQKDEYGSTPVMIATTFGKEDVAVALIEAGADLNLQNNEGATPLHTAAFLCRKEIVEALLANGADKSIRDNYGSTAYESVAAPFELVKPVYDELGKSLGVLGLKLDYDYLKQTRPLIADLLK